MIASFVLAVAAVPLAAATPEAAAPEAAASAPAPAAAAATVKAKLGMSAPQSAWAQRVREVGSGLEARRVFVSSLSGSLGVATQACQDGMYPVISFSPGSWAQVASGAQDAALRSLATRLGALPCDVFATLAHEPDGDGTPAQWSAMQAHALPILGADPGVKVGVIGNGWWWSGTNRGLSDAELAAWIPRSVINAADVIGGDFYQGNANGESPATKMANMASWARRVGGVRALGVGEFNAQSASGITQITDELASERLWAWGCLWNANGSGGANATILSGDRLATFKRILATW